MERRKSLIGPVCATLFASALIAVSAASPAAGTPSAAGAFVSTTPTRLLDTRSGEGAPAGALGPQSTLVLSVLGQGPVPGSGVSAVVLNVTITQPSAMGFLTVYPDGQARPTASNLNFVAGQTVPNLVVVPVGADGDVNFYNGSPGATHLIADVAGYYLAGTPTAADACGGAALPKPGGGDWVCTFDEEFNGTILDTSQWTPQLSANSGFTSGPATGPACYVNNPDNISVSGGNLNLTVRKEATPFTCTSPTGNFTTQYTAGSVSTYDGFHQTYGRFEVRAKLPSSLLSGLQETLWLWPVNDAKYGPSWPDSGEIDFAEFYSQYALLDVPYIHYVYDPATTNPLTNTNVVTAYTCPINYGAFNTYAVEWLPGKITIYTNGATCLVDNYSATGLTGAAPFDQPFFIALTQALGVGTNAPNPLTTLLPATTQIDYVRAWK